MTTELNEVNAKFAGGLLQEDLRAFVEFAAGFKLEKEWVPPNEDYPGGWVIYLRNRAAEYEAVYDPHGDRWEVIHGNVVRSYPRLQEAIGQMALDL